MPRCSISSPYLQSTSSLISALLLYQGGINFEEYLLQYILDHLDYLTFQNNPIDFAIFDGFVKAFVDFEPVYSSKIL
jgi:hypothetical protein